MNQVFFKLFSNSYCQIQRKYFSYVNHDMMQCFPFRSDEIQKFVFQDCFSFVFFRTLVLELRTDGICDHPCALPVAYLIPVRRAVSRKSEVQYGAYVKVNGKQTLILDLNFTLENYDKLKSKIPMTIHLVQHNIMSYVLIRNWAY